MERDKERQASTPVDSLATSGRPTAGPLHKTPPASYKQLSLIPWLTPQKDMKGNRLVVVLGVLVSSYVELGEGSELNNQDTPTTHRPPSNNL